MSLVYPAAFLIALVAAVAIYFFMQSSQGRIRRRVGRFISKRLANRLLQHESRRITWSRNVLLLLSIVFLGFAAARPQWGNETIELNAAGIDILFALDASKSMLAEDIPPSRMQRSKMAIEALLPQIRGDRVGLIAFTGEAFLQCPLPFDTNAFRLALDAVEADIIPYRGTNIAAAIKEADAAFPENQNMKILVLLTDGEDLEASGIEAAREAAEKGMTIYTVGVGSRNGSRIQVRDRFGNINYLTNDDGTQVITRLDDDTLRHIAEAAGGLYVPLGVAGTGLERLYNERLSEIPDELRDSTEREISHERFTWFAIPGLICLTLSFFINNRRSRTLGQSMKAAAILTLSSFALPQYTEASAYTGTQQLQDGDIPAAQITLSLAAEEEPENVLLAYNLGVAAFRNDDFIKAAEGFKNALRTGDIVLQADAFYSLGLSQTLQALKVDVSTFDLLQINEQIRSLFETAAQALEAGEQALTNIPARRDAWTRCEQILRAVRALNENVSDQAPQPRARFSLLNEAQTNWLNAAELDPEAEDVSSNLDKLTSWIEQQGPPWKEFERHETMIPRIEAALEEMIQALKSPTEAVLQAEALADQWVTENRFIEAAELLNEVAKQDPTSIHFQDKRMRISAISNILAPPPPPDEAERSRAEGESESPLP